MISTERLPYERAQQHDGMTTEMSHAVDLTLPFSCGITAPDDFRLGVELEYFPVDRVTSTLLDIAYHARLAQEQAEEHSLRPLDAILAPGYMAARQQRIIADVPGYVRAQLL